MLPIKSVQAASVGDCTHEHCGAEDSTARKILLRTVPTFIPSNIIGLSELLEPYHYSGYSKLM